MNPSNVFYYRSGKENNLEFSVVKFDLADSLKDPRANGIACSEALDGKGSLGGQMRETIRLLERYGLRVYVPDRIRKGKSFAVGASELPEKELRLIGWRIMRYPNKYRPCADRDDALDRARRFGIHIDASNIIINRHNSRGALALKALIDWCIANGIRWHIYFDRKTWGCLKKSDYAGYRYFQSLYKERIDGEKRFCTPPKWSIKTADDIMFDYANTDGGSLVSRDTFDEWDYLGWTLNGAETGKQRLHKFWTTDTTISVPDIGLYAKIPQSY